MCANRTKNNASQTRKAEGIDAFGIERPSLTGCASTLLRRFCSDGKGLITELIDECEQHSLFKQIGEEK